MKQNEIVVKCCKCQRVRVHGNWKPEENGPSDDQLYSHGYCPACLVEVHAELEVYELFMNA